MCRFNSCKLSDPYICAFAHQEEDLRVFTELDYDSHFQSQAQTINLPRPSLREFVPPLINGPGESIYWELSRFLKCVNGMASLTDEHVFLKPYPSEGREAVGLDPSKTRLKRKKCMTHYSHPSKPCLLGLLISCGKIISTRSRKLIAAASTRSRSNTNTFCASSVTMLRSLL